MHGFNFWRFSKDLFSCFCQACYSSLIGFRAGHTLEDSGHILQYYIDSNNFYAKKNDAFEAKSNPEKGMALIIPEGEFL